MSKTTNIIMLGIGGQGTLTMMEMLAIAAEDVVDLITKHRKC